MNLRPEDIDNLVKQAMEALTIDDIYTNSLSYVDIKAMEDATGLTFEEISKTFSWAGFFAGMKFTLENVDIGETDC